MWQYTAHLVLGTLCTPVCPSDLSPVTQSPGLEVASAEISLTFPSAFAPLLNPGSHHLSPRGSNKVPVCILTFPLTLQSAERQSFPKHKARNVAALLTIIPWIPSAQRNLKSLARHSRPLGVGILPLSVSHPARAPCVQTN